MLSSNNGQETANIKILVQYCFDMMEVTCHSLLPYKYLQDKNLFNTTKKKKKLYIYIVEIHKVLKEYMLVCVLISYKVSTYKIKICLIHL